MNSFIKRAIINCDVLKKDALSFRDYIAAYDYGLDAAVTNVVLWPLKPICN